MNYRRAYNLHILNNAKLPDEMIWFVEYCSKLKFKILDSGDYDFYDSDGQLVMCQELNSKWFRVGNDIWFFFKKQNILLTDVKEIIKMVVEYKFKVKLSDIYRNRL